MKAAVLEEINRLTLKDITLPEVEKGSVLLKVETASICGSDIGMLRGKVDKVRLGTVLGHEFVGKSIESGEKFAVNPYVVCGECPSCRDRSTNLCGDMKIIGGHINGGFAEYCLAPLSNLHKIGDIEPELAVFIQPLACGIAGFEKISVKKNQRVLVLGGGPMGLLLAKMCANKGAEVIISEPSAFRRKFIEKMGWGFINPTEGGEIPWSIADIVIDAVGSLMGKSFEYVRPCGEILLFGLNSKSLTQYARTINETRETISHNNKQFRLYGSFLARKGHFGKALRIMKYKSWAKFLRAMITVKLPLEQISEGFNLVEKGEAIKVLVCP